jgi:HK97 family phage portal protein
MGILSRVLDSLKASRTARVVYMQRTSAHWSNRRFADFAKEGYQRNVVAYQAIDKTSQSVAAIPVLLYRGDDEVMDHPAARLVRQPNAKQNWSSFVRDLVGYYRLSGNGYIERVLVGRDIRELYALRSDRMTVIPSASGYAAGYVYRVGQDEVRFDVDPQGRCDILHLKTFNPLDDWYGMSPIEAGAYAVDQHNESMQWIQSLLQNGAAPSGALEVAADRNLSDEAFIRLKAEIDDKYSGSRNAGRPLLLEGGMKWQQMGMSPQQMSVIETKFSAARDISLALGVPPILLNIPGDSTYANFREARLSFYEDTVIPMAQEITEQLNKWLVEVYGPDYHYELNLDKIPAIAEKRHDMWAMADKSQDLTINERREMKGYGPIAGGDVLLQPANLIPIEADMTLLHAQPDVLKALAYGEAKNPWAPTDAMVTEAERGLEWRREFGRGGTEVGVARARDIVNRRRLPIETVRRMHSYFSRHEVDKQAEGFKPGEDGYPSAGRIAWALWGGDPGQSWAARIVREYADE